jgi:hypothetical protein
MAANGEIVAQSQSALIIKHSGCTRGWPARKNAGVAQLALEKLMAVETDLRVVEKPPFVVWTRLR